MTLQEALDGLLAHHYNLSGGARGYATWLVCGRPGRLIDWLKSDRCHAEVRYIQHRSGVASDKWRQELHGVGLRLVYQQMWPLLPSQHPSFVSYCKAVGQLRGAGEHFLRESVSVMGEEG